MAQIIQHVVISLKGGQTIAIDFVAQKANELNPQIAAFMRALGEAGKKDANFVFQGQRLVLLRLSDVSAVDVLSLEKKEAAPAEAPQAAAPEVTEAPAAAEGK